MHSVSAHTLSNNGSQKMVVSLLPARTLPENGCPETVVLLSCQPHFAKQTVPGKVFHAWCQRACQEMAPIICCMSAQTLPKMCEHRVCLQIAASAAVSLELLGWLVGCLKRLRRRPLARRESAASDGNCQSTAMDGNGLAKTTDTVSMKNHLRLGVTPLRLSQYSW